MSSKKRGRAEPKEAKRPYDHLIGPARLQEWRARERLESQGAAERLGIDAATYCAFERGRKRPGIDIAMRIQIRTGGRVLLSHWVDPRKASTLRVAA